MKSKTILSCAIILITIALVACRKNSGNDQMARILKAIHDQNNVRDNFFAPEAKVRYYDSLLLTAQNDEQTISYNYFKGYFLLQTGEVEQAIDIYQHLLSNMGPENQEAIDLVNKYLGVAYFRLGEQINCVTARTAASCIFPIEGDGIHHDHIGSKKAIEHFEAVLRNNPDDLETRWLLNIAHMTVGEYPHKVPDDLLIPGLADSTIALNPFQEISTDLGMTARSMSGGVIVDDFNLDGYPDIVTSAWGLDEPMQYWVNNGDGTFTDHAVSSRLATLTGGLNIMQTDYNNDGYPDIFVLRGGWMARYGKQPNSLLRNNGNGTFTDVTFESGLTSFLPSQTATWHDFNNDGWLDVFIGNESRLEPLPCELYLNQKNGTFRNIAPEANVNIMDYVKASTSGDYDNDGWPDLFLSTMNNRSYLLRNLGLVDGQVRFEDVTQAAGFGTDINKTFPTWFWDYDNDGWLDIFISAYEFEKSLGHYEALEKLNQPLPEVSKMKLYHNNGDGTFTNVANQVGLNRVVNAMGANFGDIDNDGFLDFYLGTGNPDTKSIIPNRLFRNQGGASFVDVTASARVGHLQKGHGIAFTDLNLDGNVDIILQVGGSFKGESFQNAVFINPGQGENKWIGIKLEGVQSNRLGIGSRIKVSFVEEGKERHVYRDVNSGGSFGSSSLMAHIGIGKADLISRIEIRWPGSSIVQEFTDVRPNQFIHIREGSDEIQSLPMNPITLGKPTSNLGH
jgi:tetratricopeptide (TPR) repeat protein